MKKDEKQRCKNCRFFEDPTVVTNGLCRIRPPESRNDGAGYWPEVSPEDWCGNFMWADGWNL